MSKLPLYLFLNVHNKHSYLFIIQNLHNVTKITNYLSLKFFWYYFLFTILVYFLKITLRNVGSFFQTKNYTLQFIKIATYLLYSSSRINIYYGKVQTVASCKFTLIFY